mmetsp:Transcript_8038/g.17429  ORF Transcript_8038/g.17429 Transcript_8038/m.17429 type:complete len:626 (+) Transcript_8038:77-1954(+)|eukprot:CAMPEP_0170577416 /NCGR_PEP_ID=MMETSP0224-20130122/4914_1 /TAXON_ID=285029 /ORGANISM="Togula jolla, Strain CCCM 725" /LENGTH=625 /DNA_ID=CAMNT_0010900323 /DNA_START=1 /DNA_END=1878 /DNA_ORIENTATION=+
MPRFEVAFPKGIAFRQSAELQDRAPHVAAVKKGEIVEGELVAGGQWLQLSGESLFLPLQAPDGTALLRRLQDDTGQPSGKKFVPWRGVEETVSRTSSSGHGLERPRETELARRPSKTSRDPELAALDKRYDQKKGVRSAARTPPLGQMVNSHDRATAYMHEFRDAMEEMGIDTKGDPYLERYAPIGGAVDEVKPGPAAGSLAAAAAARRNTGSAGGSRCGSGAGRSAGRRPSAGQEPGSGSGLALCGSLVVGDSPASGSQGRWKEGPRNAIIPVTEWVSVKHGREVQNQASSGRVIDVSDRNVLCMSVLGEKAVLGSADHGLKEVNIRAGQLVRNLYTKRYGHAEWVTTVAHCPDGRIVSGGQDSKLCLWNASGVVCTDMTGHMGAISRVRVDGTGKLAISGSYDRTLSVWDLRSRRAAASCTGHNAPVMDFVWWENIVASGDRSGLVKLWDTSSAQNTGTLKGHKGHITAMLAVSEGDGTPTVLTGAQDGNIRVWDLRQRLNTFNMACHPGGAVNELGATTSREPRLVVSAGADGRVLVLEPRSSYAPLFEFNQITEDFIYSLLVLDSVAFTGDGRGLVSCFDLESGQKKYELRAGENAIRCLGATSTSLICSGDDGNAVIFDF